MDRYCAINQLEEVSKLEHGMDFRLPQYRREVFLRFYEFHLKYYAHPGAVYYTFPFIFKTRCFDEEQKLWFAFLNGCTQNVISTYFIFCEFPDVHNLDQKKFGKWFRKHYPKFGWDTDRRYVKNQFEKCVESYVKNLNGRSQVDMFKSVCKGKTKYDNFDDVWDYVINNFYLFGRLATFSYLEYLRLAGLDLDCSQLFLDDITGSKSHRNGICKVLGRDDMDWYKKEVVYDDLTINSLKVEGAKLLEEAKERINHKDVSYFTLESTLCCYKSWHRPNRRYPNVYNDMFYQRIKHGERAWGESLQIFWRSRDKVLPPALRVECMIGDEPLTKVKQNHYRKTGQVINMDVMWDCFDNDWNDYLRKQNKR